MTRLIVTYDPPPIPVRYFDWTATEDGYEPGCPIGYGRTRDEAVADLEEQLAERAHQYADRLQARCVGLTPDMQRCVEVARQTPARQGVRYAQEVADAED